jgi:hypothetical protein
MPIPEITALIVAVTALVSAVSAIVHSLRTRRIVAKVTPQRKP